MNDDEVEREAQVFLEDLASERRQEFPIGFAEYIAYSDGRLSAGAWPGEWRYRGEGATQEGPKLAAAVLEELRLLLCEKDKKYHDVIKSGKGAVKGIVTAVSGYVAGVFGIGVALASSLVAAVLLLVVRVGLEAFCRIAGRRTAVR